MTGPSSAFAASCGIVVGEVAVACREDSVLELDVVQCVPVAGDKDMVDDGLLSCPPQCMTTRIRCMAFIHWLSRFKIQIFQNSKIKKKQTWIVYI